MLDATAQLQLFHREHSLTAYLLQVLVGSSFGKISIVKICLILGIAKLASPPPPPFLDANIIVKQCFPLMTEPSTYDDNEG